MGVEASVLQVYFLFRYCSGVVELTYFIRSNKKKHKKRVEEEHLKDKDLDGTKQFIFHVFFSIILQFMVLSFSGKTLGRKVLVCGIAGSGSSAAQ